LKYIVLYTALILLLIPGETKAQKQVYFLIPSARTHIHPEAMVDTMAISDSAIFPDSVLIPELRNNAVERAEEEPAKPDKNGSRLMVSFIRNILSPWRVVYVFMPWPFFTALKS